MAGTDKIPRARVKAKERDMINELKKMQQINRIFSVLICCKK
jgi:hypothetical protein